ncbi:hypothetical protein A2686_03865 [Candidatus Woesebacteria bacterium RIFCSPHIGHO2_01_FULL_38_10]|uniref:DUF4870 domain-containing protein n=1 Tax=Candidatus Woesebacteria bacterium RIFCSPLOWO2_01_FULL_39_10b TaxID=1802517 RepID=A0A1F8B7G8_9BACT|nr:MAG: hypothetical protein A2686_03865 [Candidatus Woesebacteria bacterium RIFCSPHIGHO2_01_FULL_38_10]OGM59984.1 MAG: hypothetical protein A2892_03745 [Candidatus Woesebacteria bacterium RIFCSPLOWO2_01_FULL_39_10b]
MAAVKPKSATGLPKTTAAALSVILAPTVVGTLVFLFLEKDPFVRFYSLQVLVTGLILIIIQWALSITLVLLPLAGLVTILGFVLWLAMIYKAWQGDEWEVPVLGDIARRIMKKI